MPPVLRRLAAASALLVFGCLALPPLCLGDSMETTTYYPSPAGVYRRLSADNVDFRPIGLGDPSVCTYAGFGAPCLRKDEKVPRAGQVFFSREKNQLYYASRDAVPGDPTTWYRPVSGFEETPIARGTVASFNFKPNNLKTQWVSGWAASVGKVDCSGKCLAAAKQKISGLYVLTLSGTLCSPGSLLAGDTTANPGFWLFRAPKGGGWSVVGTSNDDIDLDPATGCGTFGLEAMLMLPVNRIPLFGMKFRREKKGDYVKGVFMDATRIIGL